MQTAHDATSLAIIAGIMGLYRNVVKLRTGICQHPALSTTIPGASQCAPNSIYLSFPRTSDSLLERPLAKITNMPDSPCWIYTALHSALMRRSSPNNCILPMRGLMVRLVGNRNNAHNFDCMSGRARRKQRPYRVLPT